MLSRVANNLYWLSRYLERAENLARLVQVNHANSIEAVANGHEDAIWQAVLYATNSGEAYSAAQDEAGGELDVCSYMTFSGANPDSIRQCIAQARENARMVRDQIPEEMWLELNTIHLFIQSGASETMWERQPDELYRRVIRFCMLYGGLIESTTLHDEGWDFVQVGRYLERADKTSRILDMLSFHQSQDRSQLISALRSCSGSAGFRSEFRGDVSLENVASFLLFSPSFPRSVRFCLRQLDDVLHSISGMPSGSFSNEAERITGSLLAQMNFSNAQSIWDTGLHLYIDNLQQEMNKIGQQVFETYVLLPSEINDIPHTGTWQVQQQQQ